MKRPLSTLARLFAAGAALIVLVALPASSFAATSWYVSNTGNDGNNCMSVPTACATIQAAVNKASVGDTITVLAGTYPEAAPGPLTINKQLTVLGAQAGVDARTRAGAESIISDPQGTQISANDVTFDGFTVQGGTAVYTGFGVWAGPSTTGVDILNNIFQQNTAGLGIGSSDSTIVHNRFVANNASGSATGSGIYTDQYISGGTLRTVLVQENAFVDNDNAGIDISNTDAQHGVYELDVADNSFDGNGRGVLLFNTHDSTIHGNRITNSTLAQSGAIRIFDNNTDLTITENDLVNGVGRGIRVSYGGAVGDPSKNVDINYNNIGTVGSASFVDEGLRVEVGGHQGTLDATCNWWGSTTGPTNGSNPSGTGEEVAGDADFTPWLVGLAPDGACLGGLPPTPGKATGGGQVQGDPVFSPQGSLLSAPAVIASAASPTAQATFGFTVQCCAPKGNLEYDDHPQDVRIKARTVDGLFISSPGQACPATPGSKHATFTGTAQVIRATGTTTERFTADADDCGEPGTLDTFGIKTDTYDNGPNVLLGGNIQIHR